MNLQPLFLLQVGNFTKNHVIFFNFWTWTFSTKILVPHLNFLACFFLWCKPFLKYKSNRCCVVKSDVCLAVKHLLLPWIYQYLPWRDFSSENFNYRPVPKKMWFMQKNDKIPKNIWLSGFPRTCSWIFFKCRKLLNFWMKMSSNLFKTDAALF